MNAERRQDSTAAPDRYAYTTPHGNDRRTGLRSSYGIAVCGIGRYGRAILEAAQSSSATAESPGHPQRPTVRMHLAELKNQRRAEQPRRTDEIAVIGAVAPKHAGIARLKRNDVLLGSVENRSCDTAAVHRVVGQEQIDEM